MAAVNIPSPPILVGREPMDNLYTVRSYLYQVSEQLNAALNSLDAANLSAELRADIAQGAAAGSDAAKAETAEQYSTLKSLVIKTADTVRAEIEAVEGELKSSYIAKSDWGTYEENIRSSFRATAEAVVNSYQYDARLDSLESDAADFAAYMIGTSGFIRQGIIDYVGGVPVIGIAIGQDIQTTGATETIDGVTYQVFASGQNLATYTASEMAFYQNGVKLAYFSNSEMHITNAVISNRMRIGGWEFGHASGLTIRYVG